MNFLECMSDNVVVDPDKCTFCGDCVQACSLDNLRLKLSECRRACPLHLNCQGYARLIARGEPEQAWRLICSELPIAGILGRVCSQPCEEACARSDVDGQPVALRALKRFLADAGYDHPGYEIEVERSGSVAVIGAGPAGVMAAFELRRRGWRVELVDGSDRIGGNLTASIPEFRLPLSVASRELAVLERIGVRITCKTVVDEHGLDRMIADHDAVLIATGAGASETLALEGEDCPNVMSALGFLRGLKAGTVPDIGQRVVVIGGGNVAIDAAQAAWRLGAGDVRVVCLERRADMPAFDWVIRSAEAEGIRIDDGWGPVRIVTGRGRAVSVVCGECTQVYDARGRFEPQFGAGELSVMADTIVVAVGQRSDAAWAGRSGVRTASGRIVADPVTAESSRTGVFAAGDVVTGPSSVVEALAAGREAAESIHRFLLGLPLDYGRDRLSGCETGFAVDTSGADVRQRVVIPQADVNVRRSFGELELGLAAEAAAQEAGRCLSCGGVHGKHRTCWTCLPCELVCEQRALRIEIPFLIS